MFTGSKAHLSTVRHGNEDVKDDCHNDDDDDYDDDDDAALEICW